MSSHHTIFLTQKPFTQHLLPLSLLLLPLTIVSCSTSAPAGTPAAAQASSVGSLNLQRVSQVNRQVAQILQSYDLRQQKEIASYLLHSWNWKKKVSSRLARFRSDAGDMDNSAADCYSPRELLIGTSAQGTPRPLTKLQQSGLVNTSPLMQRVLTEASRGGTLADELLIALVINCLGSMPESAAPAWAFLDYFMLTEDDALPMQSIILTYLPCSTLWQTKACAPWRAAIGKLECYSIITSEIARRYTPH